eukprot:678829-Prymnesium_polylepis.1
MLARQYREARWIGGGVSAPLAPLVRALPLERRLATPTSRQIDPPPRASADHILARHAASRPCGAHHTRRQTQASRPHDHRP